MDAKSDILDTEIGTESVPLWLSRSNSQTDTGETFKPGAVFWRNLDKFRTLILGAKLTRLGTNGPNLGL